MEITWIIGNGFDLNCGLKSSYQDFIEKYWKKKAVASNQEKLEQAANKGGLLEVELWSDVEEEMGKITQVFATETIAEYETIFSEMLSLLIEYLKNQEEAISLTNIAERNVGEFYNSVTGYRKRLVQTEQDKIPNHLGSENNIYNFISLNYTTLFDSFVNAAKEKYKPFARRGSYTDKASEVFHIHGYADIEGAPIFGVGNKSQISNADLAADDEFCELWIKESQNEIAGNHRTSEFKSLVNRTNVFILYGCSLGVTDEYLLCEIGKRIKQNTSVVVVILDYELPSRTAPDRAPFVRRRREVIDMFLKRANISESNREIYEKRIVVASSKTYFKLLKDNSGGANE